jgi:hypothetical protein
MHPAWPLHHRSVPIGWQTSELVFARRAGTEAVWDPDTGGVTGGGWDYVWWGECRVQPNKDWRARRRNGEDSPTVQHAVRIQMSMDCPPILLGDAVGVLYSPYDDSLERYIFHIRNPLESSNAWGRSVLGDLDMSESSLAWDALQDLALANGWVAH